MATVTTGERAWRIATSAPASSTSFITTPPCTLPSALACSGLMSAFNITREFSDSLGCLFHALFHIWTQIRNLLEDIGVFVQYINRAEIEFGHHRRQRRAGGKLRFGWSSASVWHATHGAFRSASSGCARLCSNAQSTHHPVCKRLHPRHSQHIPRANSRSHSQSWSRANRRVYQR